MSNRPVWKRSELWSALFAASWGVVAMVVGAGIANHGAMAAGATVFVVGVVSVGLVVWMARVERGLRSDAKEQNYICRAYLPGKVDAEMSEFVGESGLESRAGLLAVEPVAPEKIDRADALIWLNSVCALIGDGLSHCGDAVRHLSEEGATHKAERDLEDLYAAVSSTVECIEHAQAALHGEPVEVSLEFEVLCLEHGAPACQRCFHCGAVVCPDCSCAVYVRGRCTVLCPRCCDAHARRKARRLEQLALDLDQTGGR